MEKNKQSYYYDKQIYRYVLQFMSIFSVFQVSVGKRDDGVGEGLADVPIHYSSQDRITHAIMAHNTQNTPVSLPAFSVYVKDIELAPDLRKGVGVEKRNAYVPVGGLLQDDVKVVHQRQPVPYYLKLELGIYVSNVDQHLQILEQILSIFDPMITIQTSDGLFDTTRITTVELTNVNLDDITSMDNTNRVIKSTLTFRLPIYLALPADVRDDVVKKILIRVGMINSSTALNDIVTELDAEGFQYQTVADALNIPVN